MPEAKIGEVTHYYGKIGVAIIKLSNTLKKGDTVHFVGHSSDFSQSVDSIQFDHKDIEAGKKGQEVGVKVNAKVHEKDEVFVVSES